METKSEYRNYAKNYRKNINIQKVSAEAVEKIRQCDLYCRANNVMLFYPMKDEINLLDLLNDCKNFYFPRVCGKDLEVCPNCESFEKSRFGISEPTSAAVSPECLDLIIVPALMCDKTGYRLGYGGGYYDRFLKICPAKTLAVVPKVFVVDKLPHNEFDIPVNYIEI